MNDGDRLDAAAAILLELRTGHRAIDELPDDVRPRSMREAYDLQARLGRALTAAGLGPRAGFKIGCTTAVMQDYLGIDHPCAGAILAQTIRHGSGTYRRAELCRPGVECEIAVDIAEDLPANVALDTRGVARHVGAARASIELVDDRWRDFSKVSTATLVADDFFNAGCVLGAPVEIDPLSLDSLEGEMRVDGKVVGTGRGADILGHPMAALAWLAEHLRARGTPLRAGQIVSLGSMVKTAWIDAGAVVEIEISALGGCSLEIE